MGTPNSGTAAVVTTTDSPVNVINDTTGSWNGLSIYLINEGAVAGFFSIDGGSSWDRLPAGPCSIGPLKLNAGNINVQVKRVASGPDLSGVFAFTN